MIERPLPVLNAPAQDRFLDLNDLLRELVAQGRLPQDAAEQCMALRRSASNAQQHPLEFIAAQLRGQVDAARQAYRKEAA